MLTMRLINIGAGDGATPLAEASLAAERPNYKEYNLAAADVGLIDPNLFQNADALAGQAQECWRLDATQVVQSAPAAGSIQIVSSQAPATDILSEVVADLSAVNAQHSFVTRTLIIPPGYLVKLTGANIDKLTLSFMPYVLQGDQQQFPISITVEPPA